MSSFLSGNWSWVALFIGVAILLDMWLTYKRSSYTQWTIRFFVAYSCVLITRLIPLAVMLVVAKPLLQLTSNIGTGWVLAGFVVTTVTIGIVVNIVVGKIQWFAKLRDELMPTPKDKTSKQIAFSPKET